MKNYDGLTIKEINIKLQLGHNNWYDVFWSNGKHIGEIYPLDDGFFHWDSGERNGVWSEYGLECISLLLKEMNKEWREFIDKNL
jgi:hypothetical protein